MGTTKMSSEPRTTDGKERPVKTDPTESSVLTSEQIDELAAKRAAAKANGTTKARKTTTKAATPATPKTKAAPRIKKSDLGHQLTLIRRTLKELPEDQHETATAIRKFLSASWKAIDGGDGIDGYVRTVTEARETAHTAKLTATVKSMDAALKLAGEFSNQS